jgi:hypothetical protein
MLAHVPAMPKTWREEHLKVYLAIKAKEFVEPEITKQEIRETGRDVLARSL